jgi:hypothetical protein
MRIGGGIQMRTNGGFVMLMCGGFDENIQSCSGDSVFQRLP